MTECKNIFEILEELKENAEQIDDDKLKEVEKLITEANRIFISGAGRSRFAAEDFQSSDASWIYGIFCGRAYHAVHSGRRSSDRWFRFR